MAARRNILVRALGTKGLLSPTLSSGGGEGASATPSRGDERHRGREPAYAQKLRQGRRGREPAYAQKLRQGRRGRWEKGFTLMELILVMTVLAIAVSITAPALANFFRGRTLDSEARRFLSLTRHGQSRAVAEGVPMELWLDAVNQTYGLEA